MDDLIAFLRACEDEREQDAKSHLWAAEQQAVESPADALVAAHALRPVRRRAEWVLADVAAKRAIIELCEEVYADGGGEGNFAVNVLREMGKAHADHPDYHESWWP